MQQSTLLSLPETWQDWVKDGLKRSCDPHSMLDIMVRIGGFALRSAQDALVEASDGACAHLFEGDAKLAGMPDIDTTHNTIQTPDRLVQVLLSVSTPRIVLLGNVLSEEECVGITSLCEPRLKPSMVVNNNEGGSYLHPARTSQGAFIQRGETDLAARVEARLAFLANWPIDRGEGLQVLRYDETHEYKPHFDWFNPELLGGKKHIGRSGQRLGTFVLYLNDVDSGGGTSFPKIGLEVMPRKGAALFFANTSAQGVPDQQTLHAGMPVIKGVKYVANKWLREDVF